VVTPRQCGSTGSVAMFVSLDFRFVSPISIYAFMQSIGTVDDHVAGCHRGDRIDLEHDRSGASG
jgi:3-methyladenine DNA glycosylase Tag